MRYPFIAIEGIDGAGKSTIKNILSNLFEEANVVPFVVGQHSWLDVDTTRQIVNIRDSRYELDFQTVQDSYANDKYLHSEHNIKRAIMRNAVISDRYIYSDAVYHDVLYQIPMESTLALHKELKTLEPDFILYVNVTPPVAYERLAKRSQRIQHYGRLAKLEPIHSLYETLFESDLIPTTITILKFTNDKDGLEQRIREEVWPQIHDSLVDVRF